MHTRAFLRYTEMNMYSEQEQNSILSINYMTANASQTCMYKVTWHAKPFEDETDSKEHSESQNQQHVTDWKLWTYLHM